LHFAAHGVGSDIYPERAGIVMRPGGASEDGLWQPREIRRQELRADLVTLSACETAVGRLEGQEGVANLARTFILAGAKSVVASLWMVDDRSTATLMNKFYSHAGQGKSVAVALSDAQREMIQEFGENFSPYYWAGFLVIGDGTRQLNFGATKTDKRAASQRLR
jgi:CHAT domain-containing protein